MRILGIDHIGIASGDLAKHIEIFGNKLGLEIHDIEEKDPYGGLRAAFARVGDTDLEILEDRVPDGDQKVIGFFVGQAMKKTQGNADGKVVTALFRERALG